MDIGQVPWIEDADEEIEAIDRANYEKRHFFDGQARGARLEHWASDAMKPCMREAVLAFAGHEVTDPSGQYLENIFDSGTAIEGKVIDRIKTSDRFYPFRRTLTLDLWPELTLPLKGKVDVFMLDTLGVVSPVEVKTLKEFGDSTSDTLWMKYIPRESNVAQLMCYLYAFENEYGYLWYYNKNRPFEKMYRIRWDQEWWEDSVVPFFKELEGWVIKGEVPDIPEDFLKAGHMGERFPCKTMSREGNELTRCRFHSVCWGKDDGETEEDE